MSNVDNASAQWLAMTDLSLLYREVSGIRILADIKANAKANARLTPLDLNGAKIIYKEATPDQKKIIDLMKEPNPQQSTWEYLRTMGLYKEIWGREFAHANVPSGVKEVKGIDGTTIKTLVPVPSQYMHPNYTGKIFSSTNRKEIISSYDLIYNQKKIPFETETIFDRFDANVHYMDNVLKSVNTGYDVNAYSKLLSLNKEISNYIKSLEGRNVTIRKLGARGIFTSGKKDALGIFNLTDTEKDDSQKELNEYGAMDNQKKYIVTKTPLHYQNIAFSPRELMLREETWDAMIAMANVFQVPEALVKLYIEGAGDNKLKELLKRFYVQTIIPESKDTADDINKFLKTEKYGMNFVASFDHLDFLQEDKKDESIKNRNINIAYRDMFNRGAIVYNTWLDAMGLPNDPDFGEKRVWDLTDEQLMAMNNVVKQDVPKK